MRVISTDEPVRSRVDEKGARSYTRTFLVISDTVITAIQARDAAGLPAIGSYFTHQGGIDLGAYCTEKSADKENDLASGGVVYKVTCEYKSRTSDPNKNQPNPLDRPADWKWSGATVDIAPLFDMQDKPYTSVCGDPLSTPPPRQDKLLVLQYGVNRADFEPVTAHIYFNSVNVGAFIGFPKRAAKCTRWDGSEQYENGVNFWRHEFEFQFNPNLWIPTKVLNMGPRYREMAGGPIKAVDDEHGVATGGECLLAANGTRITQAMLNAGTEPHWLQFTDYRELDFNTLNIV